MNKTATEPDDFDKHNSQIRSWMRRRWTTRAALLSVLVPVLLCLSDSRADLELCLNTATQEFALVGSDTGTLFTVGPAAVSGWVLDNLGGTGTGQVEYDNDVAYTTTLGTPGGLGDPFNWDIQMISTATDDGAIRVALATSTAGLATLTGTGVFQSYASLGTDPIARLEGEIGNTLLLNIGAGFNDLKIVAVGGHVAPEPSAFLLGLPIVALLFHRRRCQTR